METAQAGPQDADLSRPEDRHSKKLPGVSPAIEKNLNDLGIFHYQQLAELSSTAAHNVGEEVGLPGRVDAWVNKAKELTAEAE